MQKLTFKSIRRILDRRERTRLLVLAWLRVGANLLDLVGLAGIALLATSFSSFASGSNTRAPISLPLVGEIVMDEYEAVLVAFGVAGVFLLKSIFSVWLNLLTSLTVARIEGRFSAELAEEFFTPDSNSNAGSESVADFQNKVMYSTGAISRFLNARLSFVAEGSLAASMILIFAFVNPVATISMFIFMSGILALLNRAIGFRITRNGLRAMAGSQKSLESSRDLFGIRREALSSGVTAGWLTKFSMSRKQAAEASAVIYTLNSLPRYVVETSLVLSIFAFIGGVVVFSDLSSQAITIGVFMAGGLRLVASILPIQAAYNSMQDGSARGQIAFEGLVLRRSKTQSTSKTPKVVFEEVPNLLFENVSFSFRSGQADVISQVSFEVKPLTQVALVGPSGAGKSTIFDLATGFRVPSMGAITIGGVNPRDVLFGAPGTFGIVTQRPHLITGSILENVSLADGSATDVSQAKKSLERAGLAKFTELANWYETQIKPDSGQLSGGEIQRLGLARALYREPKILFLDEATSALDAETEAQVTEVLQALKSEMTVVLIAHRLSTVKNADRIMYLDRGRLLAEGTFEELKATLPDFSRAVELLRMP